MDPGNSERTYARPVPRNQHHPSPEERDERVKVDLRPDEFIAGAAQAGPHPDEDEGDEESADED